MGADKDKARSPRRRFDSSSLIPRSTSELPDVPLPAEVPMPELPRPAADAPVVLVPIGKLDDKLLRAIVSGVQQAFGRPVQIAKSLPVPKYAYNPSREQYHSAAILKRVESIRSDTWDAAIGVTAADLFVPEVPFVFGEADRSTRSAVISTARLGPEGSPVDARNELVVKRLTSEVIHQMGLIRGLAHCPNNRCVMFQSTSVQDTDKKGLQFCANCRKRLVAEGL